MTYAGALVILILVGSVIGYLSGSVLYAVHIGKWLGKKDLRKFGSGNPGFTNTTRVFGWKIGAFVLICDVLKAVIPTLIMFIIYWFSLKNVLDAHITTRYNPAIFIYFAGFFAVLGHLFPVYYKFKGGKGIASLGGLLLIMSPFMGATAGLIIILCVLITRYVSLGSVIAVLLAPFLALVPGVNYTYLMYPDIHFSVWTAIHEPCVFLPLFGMLLFLGIFIIVLHIPNLKRIAKGVENKFWKIPSKDKVENKVSTDIQK